MGAGGTALIGFPVVRRILGYGVAPKRYRFERGGRLWGAMKTVDDVIKVGSMARGADCGVSMSGILCEVEFYSVHV